MKIYYAINPYVTKEQREKQFVTSVTNVPSSANVHSIPDDWVITEFDEAEGFERKDAEEAIYQTTENLASSNISYELRDHNGFSSWIITQIKGLEDLNEKEREIYIMNFWDKHVPKQYRNYVDEGFAKTKIKWCTVIGKEHWKKICKHEGKDWNEYTKEKVLDTYLPKKVNEIEKNFVITQKSKPKQEKGFIKGNRNNDLFSKTLKVIKKFNDNQTNSLPEKEVEAVVSSAFSYKEEREPLKLRSYKDFEKIKKPTDYFVKDLLPVKSLTMLYSPPASFKSLFSNAIAMCIATGKPFLDFKTKKHRVLISDKENNDFIIKERLQKIRKGLKIKSKSFPLYYLNRKEADLDNKKFIKDLEQAIQKHKIDLIIFDTLNRHSAYEENSATDVSKLYTDVFVPLIDTFGVSIIFLHHTNKSGEYRGSGDFLGMCDLVYKVKRSGNSDKAILTNEKNRNGEIEELSFSIDFQDDKIVLDKIDPSQTKDEEKQKFTEAVHFIKDCLTGGKLKRKDIMQRAEAQGKNITLSTMKNALSWLIKQGEIYQPQSTYYAFVSPQPIVEEEKI